MIEQPQRKVMTMIRTHYALRAMCDGELMNGMYTASDAAESADVARTLRRPHATGQTHTALCRVETCEDLHGEPSRRQVSCTILEILPD